MGGDGVGKAVWARAFLKPSPVACLEKDLIFTSEEKQDALLLTGLFSQLLWETFPGCAPHF